MLPSRLRLLLAALLATCALAAAADTRRLSRSLALSALPKARTIR